MNEFINQLSQESAIMVLESDIAIDRAISDYMTESSMMSLVDVYMESDEARGKAEENKFKAFINKLISVIKKLAHNISEGFKDIFVRDNMTADDYFANPDVQIAISKDFKKMADEIEDEIIKGRKYVQAISKGTGIDDHTIAAYCDNAANFAMEEGKYVIAGASAMALSRYFKKRVSSISKDLEYDYNALDKAVNEKIREDRYAADNMKITDKYADKSVRKTVFSAAANVRKQASSVCSAMNRLFVKYCALSNELNGEIRRAKNRKKSSK
jgi:hypothetical protein